MSVPAPTGTDPVSRTAVATSARARSMGAELTLSLGTRATGDVDVRLSVLGLELLDEQALVQPAVLGEPLLRCRGR